MLIVDDHDTMNKNKDSKVKVLLQKGKKERMEKKHHELLKSKTVKAMQASAARSIKQQKAKRLK